MNTWGSNIKVSIFGESHGRGIGIVIDGLPGGIELDTEQIKREMQRRAPGRSSISTSRTEADEVEILSGFFDGKTTGTPLAGIIRNTNTISKHYDKDLIRPGHADYTGFTKYGPAHDYRGGGHFSGRITAPLVFAGAIAKQLLNMHGICIGAHILRIKNISDDSFDPIGVTEQQLREISGKDFPVIDDYKADMMKNRIWEAKTEKDSDSSSSREKEGTPTVGTASAEKTPQKKEGKGLFGFLHGGGNGETAGEDARLPLPSLNLLTQSSKEESSQKPDQALLERKGAALMECLQNFGVTAELDHISPGPVITLFALRPAPGVKAGRFAPLSQDIAMSLKAEAVRVQAPIPGTDTVGVEVPNEKRAVVRFRDIIQNDAFRSAPSLLTLALGKDIAGAPRTDDLARMPHLLLAGATGAGKSVCLNAILLSLLYKARPDEVKLLLIDPKVVEFQVYDELPHLVHPVVSDMDLARNALMWAVDEMERRYVLLNELGVRKLDDFNRKVRTMEDPRSRKGEELSPLPYIVIVVDEFGDLILNKGKEIESAIARLGQKARAAGIHLILATQSPRADVVTGLIKANLPSRIAFRTSGPTESRIIIDQGGAEALLGNGDMLLKASNGKLHRLHGAYVSDAEVEAVVGHWKKLRSPDYKVDFRDYGETGQDGSFSGERGEGAFDKNDVIDDPLYAEAVQFAREKGFVSISKLQQRYRIGFNKAARFVDQMEQDGLIGPPPPGGKPRQVIG